MSRGQGSGHRACLFGSGGARLEEINQSFNGQFEEQEWLGNEIISSAHGGIGAAFQIVKAGNENDRGGFMRGKHA